MVANGPVVPFFTDGPQTALVILAVDSSIEVARTGKDLGRLRTLIAIRRKLESSIKPFEFTQEELAVIALSLGALQQESRGRGFIRLLEQIRGELVGIVNAYQAGALDDRSGNLKGQPHLTDSYRSN